MRQCSNSLLIRSLTQLIKALSYSLQGLRAAFQEEFSFRCDTLLTLLGFMEPSFARSALGGLLILFSLVLAMAFELLNTVLKISLMSWEQTNRKKPFKSQKIVDPLPFFLCSYWPSSHGFVIFGIKQYAV